jgi:hypothetical protein
MTGILAESGKLQLLDLTSWELLGVRLSDKLTAIYFIFQTLNFFAKLVNIIVPIIGLDLPTCGA